MSQPRIRRFQLPELSPGGLAEFSGGGYVDSREFSALASGSGVLQAVDGRFEECAFSALAARELDLRNARLLQCVLGQVDSPVFQAGGAHFDDVQLAHSRFGSADLSEATGGSIVFEHCKFGWLNLRGATLRDVVFRGCVFEELDASAATLQRVSFEDCRTATLAVSGARLSSVDLRGLDFLEVPEVAGLRGATLSALQLGQLAPRLAEHLGIRIAG